MNYSSHICDCEIVGDVILAGFDINFDFGETGDIREALTIVRELVFRGCDQALSGKRSDRSFGVLVDFGGSFVTVVNPAQFDGVLRGLRQGHASAATFVEHALVRNFVLLGLSAMNFGADLLQLAFGIERGGVGGAAHGMSGLAASGDASPG